MAARRFFPGPGWLGATILGVVALGVVALASAGASAADKPTTAESGQWYVVGSPNGHAEDLSSDRLDFDRGRQPVELGLTFSNAAINDVLMFSSGRTQTGAPEQDGYSFHVSGAYDWNTGTVITPRVMAGIGVSYVEAGAVHGGSAGDPGGKDNVAPTFQLGVGADIGLIGPWALSAEYRAFYQGATELEGRFGEERLDQKFMLGAKIRF